MADKNFNLNINLTTGESRAEVDKLNKELADLKQAIKDSNNEAKKNTASMGTSFSSLLGPIAGITAGFIGIRSIGNFLSESISGANEQEKSLIKLSQALRATNSYSDESVTIFADFADQLEATTGIQGEAVIESIAMAKQMGATNDQARNLTLAAANLAATFGGDLNSRTIELGKSLNGNTGRLKQLIPELKNLTTEQLNAGAASDIINKKFGGNAAAASNTFSGAMGRIGKAWNDIQKQIGTSIISSPEFKETLENVAIAIKNIGDIIADNMPTAIKYVNQFARGLNIMYTESLSNERLNRFKTLGNEINILQEAIKKAEANPATGWLDKITGRDVTQSKFLTDARKELADLRKEYNAIDFTQPLGGGGSTNPKVPTKDPKGGSGTGTVVDDSIIDKRAELNSQLTNLQAQFDQQEKQAAFDKQAQATEAATTNDQAKIDAYVKAQTDLYNHTLLMNDIIFQGEDAKAQTLGDAEQIEDARAIARLNKKMANAKAEQQLAKDQAKAMANFEKTKQDGINKNMMLGFDLAANIVGDGTKEQFIIQKMGALAQVWMAYGQAQGMIPMQVAPIPDATPTQSIRMGAAAGLAANNLTTALLGTGIIAAQAIKGFAKGGTVTGGTAGKDSVMGMLMPNEEVLPVPLATAFRDFVYNIDNYRLGTGAIVEAINNWGSQQAPTPVYINGTKLNKETAFESGLRLSV